MIWYLKDLDHKLLRHQYKLLRVFSNQWWNDEFSFIISVTQFRLVFAHLNWHRCNLLLCLINTRWTTLGNRLVRLYIYTIQHTPELSRFYCQLLRTSLVRFKSNPICMDGPRNVHLRYLYCESYRVDQEVFSMR